AWIVREVEVGYSIPLDRDMEEPRKRVITWQQRSLLRIALTVEGDPLNFEIDAGLEPIGDGDTRRSRKVIEPFVSSQVILSHEIVGDLDDEFRARRVFKKQLERIVPPKR